jgi:hypothetical protein
MHKTIHSKRKHFWWLLGSISLVIASDTPPTTLPKGFLEQLPLLERFQDQEFENFLQFVQQQKILTLPKLEQNETQDIIQSVNDAL